MITAKILHLDATTLRVSARIMGQYENTYASEIEIDRKENEAIDSSCSCSSRYDCQHLAALVCYMEVYLDEILVNYSKETNLSRLTDEKGFDDEAKEKLLEAVKEAETKEEQRRDEEYQKEVLAEYTDAATILSDSPFFRPAKERKPEEATFSLIYHFPPRTDSNDHDPIVRIVVKPASRSKPLAIPDPIAFFEGIRHRETVSIGGREYYFTPETFNETEREIILLLTDSIRHVELRETKTQARGMKLFRMDSKVFGRVLARARQEAASSPPRTGKPLVLPCLYHENTDRPLKNSDIPARIKMTIEFIHPPTTKILVNPHILLGTETIAPADEELIECETPGLIYEDI
ncbi:MAG: hypothetical protein OXF02_06805 [Simkaniaceae bacterium]|nr:hypothetical protein [Simkaniaceae bacterium]